MFAVVGHLRGRSIRGVCWKMFLGVLPGASAKSWPAYLEANRSKYWTLKDQLMVDPSQVLGQINLKLNTLIYICYFEGGCGTPSFSC